MEEIEGTRDIHHLRLWSMQEHDAALQAHIVIEPGAWSRADSIKAAAKAMLRERFGIGHSTLELECAQHACEGAARIGVG